MYSRYQRSQRHRRVQSSSMQRRRGQSWSLPRPLVKLSMALRQVHLHYHIEIHFCKNN